MASSTVVHVRSLLGAEGTDVAAAPVPVESDPSAASTVNHVDQREKMRQLLRKQEEEKKRIAEQVGYSVCVPSYHLI